MENRHICGLMCFAVCLICFTQAPAVANKSNSSPNTERRAKNAFEKGTRLFNERDYIGALEAFEQAYRLKPHYIIQCNIARCYERLIDMIKAAEHYHMCLIEGANQSQMGQRVKEAVAQVESRITWIMVQSPGKGGIVYVDGKEMGLTPLRVALNPGNRVIEVRRKGANPASTTLTTRGGEMRVIELTPIELPPIPSTAESDRLNNANKKNANNSRIFQENEHVSSEKSPSTILVSQPKKTEISSMWFWTSAVLTAGCAITASVLGIQALNMKNDYETLPTRDGYNQTKDKRLIANIFWGVTLAMAGTSTVLFFFTDFQGNPHSPKSSAALGIGLGGKF